MRNWVSMLEEYHVRMCSIVIVVVVVPPALFDWSEGLLDVVLEPLLTLGFPPLLKLNRHRVLYNRQLQMNGVAATFG
jgi:hypothetical protein